MPQLDEFTTAYIECLLWSSTDESDDSGGQPLDANYSASDLAPETLARIIADCTSFQVECDELISDSLSSWDRAGHDFWLTRNGHGTGFWSGAWPEPAATELTKASERAGHVDAYIGDDGQIYLSPDPAAARQLAQRLDPDAFTGGSL